MTDRPDAAPPSANGPNPVEIARDLAAEYAGRLWLEVDFVPDWESVGVPPTGGRMTDERVKLRCEGGPLDGWDVTIRADCDLHFDAQPTPDGWTNGGTYQQLVAEQSRRLVWREGA